MKSLFKNIRQAHLSSWLKVLAGVGLFMVVANAMAASGTPQNFSALTTNVQSLERQILTIVQIVVTLCGILLVFRGVVHLKQHSSGSPQEKHLSKGISSIIFAAILFIVVPLLHMFVGTLSAGGVGSQNTWSAGGASQAGDLSS